MLYCPLSAKNKLKRRMGKQAPILKNDFNCIYCKCKLTNSRSKTRHERSCKQNKKYKPTFSLRSKEKGYKYKCDFCDRKFLSKYGLTIHQNKYCIYLQDKGELFHLALLQPKYYCGKCDEKFYTKYNCDLHEKECYFITKITSLRNGKIFHKYV